MIIATRIRFPKPDPKKLEFLKSIEIKWQKIWREKKVFEPEPNGKPKFFITFPYPYVNAFPHLGSAYTVLRVDIMARYKRMKGYNVLFPQGWHATGGPIVAAALRIRERDPKQIHILEMMGIPREEIPKFADPRYWVKFFTKEWKKDFQRYGLSIDWRREFHTTYLNPPYNKFIQWQYTKLREKGFITKGSHPVVWCPKEQKVVGDHDRPDEYAGIGPEEVIIIKFRGEDGLVYPCMTYRPETVYGAVNIWVKPDADYLIAEVDGEKWIIGAYGLKELSAQDHDVKIVSKISGHELIGRFAINPVTGWRVPILPADFIDLEIGTGVVMSVPAHAPYDYIALEDLRRDIYILDKYGLEIGIIESVKPVSIIHLEGYGEYPAKTIIERLGIKNQLEKEKLEKATKEIYTKEYHQGILKEVFGKWRGKTVADAKEDIISYFISKNIAIRHYTLPTPVYCRCGSRTHVKIVRDQWFLRYSDPQWKKLAHECIDRMRFLPEEIRNYFHNQIDWYKDWACTHKGELGSPLPWDSSWVLESLSDSTIYMAYYVLAKYLQHPEKYGIKWDKINNDFFDYVLLGKGSLEQVSQTTGLSRELIEQMREEFLYWYPVDLRISGKDLMPNHLVFFIFHHTAIFPKKYWPRGIGVNGWMLIAGEKMSKSKGNFILLREALEWWGADATRFAEAYAGNSGLDDPNFEPEIASKAVDLLIDWYSFAVENYGKGRDSWSYIDDWFRSVLYKTLKEVEDEMENANYKTVLVKGFFNLQNIFKWYLKRCNGQPNRKVLKDFIEIQTKILAPITPHIAEEVWEKIGKRKLISVSPWPTVEEEVIKPEIEKAEEIVKCVLEDIKEILGLIKRKPKRVVLVIASQWKYDFIKRVKSRIESGSKLKEAIREVIKTMPDDKRAEAGKAASILARNPRSIQLLIDKKIEKEVLKEALPFYEGETGMKIDIIEEEKTILSKGKIALPARPAIVVEYQ